MPLLRRHLLGQPHTYFVQISCTRGEALFAAAAECQHFLTHLEAVRTAFDCRIFSYCVLSDRIGLVIRHASDFTDHDARERWEQLRGAPVPIERLRRRLGSLSGFMQTLLQRYSRERNRRDHRRGSLWTGRYRACLLADDAALLAAMSWLEATTIDSARSSSRGQHSDRESPPVLASPPLRIGPDRQLFASDESPPGLSPPPSADIQYWLDRFVAGLSGETLAAYGNALEHGWALGRPESLSETVARMGRGRGRGRSRMLRELADELGLCGVWG